jgi:hypothetical protein
MAGIPKLKRNIRAFLVQEKGSVKKKNLVKAGIVIASIAAADMVAADHSSHSNNYDPNCPDIKAKDNGAKHDNSLVIDHKEKSIEAIHNHCIETHSNSHSESGNGGKM